MKWLGALAGAAMLVASQSACAAGTIAIVAAENFYGDVAQQIGGADVTVRSILNNPDADPHLFEASPSVARALAAARIVVYNGIGYDPWMEQLLAATRNGQRRAIAVAQLIGKKPGDNPHIWYDPKTMPAFAQALTAALIGADPAHRGDYHDGLARFEGALAPVAAKVAALRARLAGTPAAATEPIFGYMFDALGMEVRNRSFQLAVMNDTEPSASDIAAFENDLKTHRVKLLVYNRQASDPMAERMVRFAKAAQVPVVGATETEPPGKSYQAWMADELDAIGRALPK